MNSLLIQAGVSLICFFWHFDSNLNQTGIEMSDNLNFVILQVLLLVRGLFGAFNNSLCLHVHRKCADSLPRNIRGRFSSQSGDDMERGLLGYALSVLVQRSWGIRRFSL